MKQIATKKLSLMQNLFSATTKKVIVAIVLFSMFANGFVPASQQSKNNVFVLTTVAISNSIFEVVGQCRDKLAEISNNLAKDLYKLLLAKEVGTNVPYNSNDKEDPTPVNTSSDVAIVAERDNSFQLIKYENKNNLVIFAVGKIQEDLYILYKHIKDYCSLVLNTTGILTFILFVFIVIMRKKDVININKINMYTGYKTNLCL